MNNLIDFIVPFSEEIQEIEDSLYDLRTKRSLNTAEGAQLDIIGNLVGEERNGLSDAAYLEKIRIKIIVNVASGKISTIIQYVKNITNSTVVKYIEEYPAGVILYVDGDDTVAEATSFATIASFLKKLMPAGVRLKSLRYLNPSYEPFAFGDDGSFVSEGEGFFELGYPESNGYTAGAFSEATN
jgi:hypothetical protein